MTSSPIPGLTRLIYDVTTSHSVISQFNVKSDTILDNYGITGIDRDYVLKGNLPAMRRKVRSTFKDWVNADNIKYSYHAQEPLPKVPIHLRADDYPHAIKFGLTRLMFEMALNASLVKAENKLSDAIFSEYNLTDEEKEVLRNKNFKKLQDIMSTQAEEWIQDTGVEFHIGYGYPLGPVPREICASPLFYCIPKAQIHTLQFREEFTDEGRMEKRLIIGGKAFPEKVVATLEQIAPVAKCVFKGLEMSSGRHSTWMHSWVYTEWDNKLDSGTYKIQVYDMEADDAEYEPIEDILEHPDPEYIAINNNKPFINPIK